MRPKLVVFSDQNPTQLLPARCLLQPPLPAALQHLNGRLLQSLPTSVYTLPGNLHVLQFADDALALNISYLYETRYYKGDSLLSTAAISLPQNRFCAYNALVSSLPVAPQQWNAHEHTADFIEYGLIRQTLYFEGTYMRGFCVDDVCAVVSFLGTTVYFYLHYNGVFKRFSLSLESEICAVDFDGLCFVVAEVDAYLTFCSIEDLTSGVKPRKFAATFENSDGQCTQRRAPPCIAAVSICSRSDLLLAGYSSGEFVLFSVAGDALFACDFSAIFGVAAPIFSVSQTSTASALQILVLAHRTPPIVMTLDLSNSAVALAYFSMNPHGVCRFRRLPDVTLLTLARSVDLWNSAPADRRVGTHIKRAATYCLKSMQRTRSVVAYQAEEQPLEADNPLCTIHKALFYSFECPIGNSDSDLLAAQLEALFCLARQRGATNGAQTADFRLFVSVVRQILVCSKKFRLANALDPAAPSLAAILSPGQRIQPTPADGWRFAAPRGVAAGGNYFARFLTGELGCAREQFTALAAGCGPSSVCEAGAEAEKESQESCGLSSCSQKPRDRY